jgi:LacI family transcriptional regulator
MGVTIKDIANKLDLSYSSVSRALNDKPGVSEDTRKMVLKVAEEFGYTPNELARSLVNKSSNTIGVILPDIKNAYFSEVLQGVIDAASTSKYTTLFCISNWDQAKELQYITELQQKRINGLILKRTNDYTDYTQKDISVPTVIIENRSAECNFSYVEVDNHLGGVIATQHLLDCGYKNIAYVGGLKDARSCLMRYKGYVQVLKESEQGFDKSRVTFGEFTLASGYNQAKAQMEKDPTIDAFFANNDFIALGILKYLRENNFSVPEQIGLIGFDNIQFSDYPDINLTTIKQPIYNIGKNAFNLLLDQMNGGPSHRVIYQPELIVRGTTSKR